MKTFIYVLLAVFVVLSAVSEIAAVSHKTATDVLGTPCTGKNYHITRAQHDWNQESLRTCKFNRSEVVEWAKKGFDLNGDMYIDMAEVKGIRDYYLTPAELASNLVETLDTIFYRCDCDGDGRISNWDFDNTPDTCLRDCGALTRINYFIGSRMADGKAFGAKKDPDAIDESMLHDNGASRTKA